MIDGPPSHHRVPRLLTRAALRRLAILFLLIFVALTWSYCSMIRMPGSSHRGPLPPLTDAQRTLADELRRDVVALAGGPGEHALTGYRSTFFPRQLAAAAAYIDAQLEAAGFEHRREVFVERGSPAPNIEVTVRGTIRPDEIIVVGAHFDSYQGTPGADDNASGVAATLALARRFARDPRPRTIRFVFFVNEEPPAFQTPDMGSWVYAKACREAGDDIAAMLSIESVGYYSDQPGTQNYPRPLNLLYPSTGDFVAFVGGYRHRALVRRCVASFRGHAEFPSEGAALFEGVPGVGWSDHWAFWQEGYPALMVTDTAPFRNPNYHLPTDTSDTLDYERMARVVDGLAAVISDLAADGPPN